MRKTESLLNVAAQVFVVLSMCFYLLSIVMISRDDLLNSYSVLGVLTIAITILFAAFISKMFKSDSQAVIVCFVLSFVVLMIWNQLVESQPDNDYEMLWRSAKQIVDGTFHERLIRKDDIFVFCSYLTGYSYYLAILYKLCLGSIVAVRIIRLFIFALINIIMFKTLRLNCGIRSAFSGVLLFLFYPFVFIGSGVFNNQHEGLLFEAISFYLVMKSMKDKDYRFHKWLIVGIVIGLADFFRPSAFVILVAVFLVAMLKAFFEKNRSLVLCAFLMVTSFVLFGYLIDKLFIITGLAPYGIKSHNYWYKLIIGLTGEGMLHHPTVDSEHTTFYYDLQYYNFDYEAYREAARRYVFSLFMNNKIKPSSVFYHLVYFAGDVDNQYWYIGSSFLDHNPLLLTVLNCIGMLIYTITLVLSIIRCCSKRILSNIAIALPAIVFVGYFLIHFVFETQTRYRYEQYYVLFLLAVPVMSHLWTSIRVKLDRSRTCL